MLSWAHAHCVHIHFSHFIDDTLGRPLSIFLAGLSILRNLLVEELADDFLELPVTLKLVPSGLVRIYQV